MRPSQLLALILVAVGAFALFMPSSGLPDSEAQAEDAEGPKALVVGAPADRKQTAWGHDVTLPRQSDGHFYANVEVDGRFYHMMIDTGATVVALSARDAEDMGIDWQSEEPNAVAMTAGGPAPALHVEIPMMRVGEFEAKNVSAMVIPGGLDVSLLGQSYLSSIGRVQISGDDMVLSPE